MAAGDGPVYFRMNRNEVPAVYGTGDAGPAADLELGRAQVVRPGSDLTVVATGVMVARAVAAAEQLAREGVQCRVIDLHTIKPLDADTLAAAARQTGAVVTAEEHNVTGGLGGAVAEALAETYPVSVVRVGIADCFTESGPYFDLLDRHGCSVADVVAGARHTVQLQGVVVAAASESNVPTHAGAHPALSNTSSGIGGPAENSPSCHCRMVVWLGGAPEGRDPTGPLSPKQRRPGMRPSCGAWPTRCGAP